MDKVTDKVEEVAVVYPQLIRDELIRFFISALMCE